jgi:carbamoyltransferase
MEVGDMTAILGLSAFYHDSAAALVVDGHLVAAAQEERFTRRKHDASFPQHAASYCLQEAGLTPRDLDAVAFYEKPLAKFDRLLETYLSFAPRGFRSFLAAMPQWLNTKLHLPRVIRRGLRGRCRAPLLFLDHHEAHAASAFLPSPFEEAAILTLDGVGEWATSTFGVGRGNRIELGEELRFPHSLGLLYAAFTSYTGFKVNSGEYKVMSLAPYGQPIYKDVILRRLLDLKADGSFRLNQSYFRYCHGLTMTSPRFHRLFGGPPRLPESPLRQRDLDLAASIQAVTEEIVLRMAGHVYRRTSQKNLVLAGGVALNCVANGRLLREGPFESLWIQPTAGDAGGALGAALFTWHQLLERPRLPQPEDAQQGSFLGPRFTDPEIAEYLHGVEALSHRYGSEEELLDAVAELLAAGKVVGWFHGRMEFGPRALGARSILADPRDPGMHELLNCKIKFRESFRPFAPCVLQEKASDYFDLPPGMNSPYMLFTAPVAARQRLAQPGHCSWDGHGLGLWHTPRSSIPAVTHIDFSARVQTVDASRHGRLYRLLRRFSERTGCPVLVNTSFNVRGEPIVCTPAEAYRCFLNTDLDAVVLENHLLLKEEQAPPSPPRREAYLGQFTLD